MNEKEEQRQQNPHNNNNNNNNNDKNIDSKNKLTTELSNTAAEAKLLFGIFSAAADVLICFSV